MQPRHVAAVAAVVVVAVVTLCSNIRLCDGWRACTFINYVTILAPLLIYTVERVRSIIMRVVHLP
jgi:hypothetical protein